MNKLLKKEYSLIWYIVYALPVPTRYIAKSALIFNCKTFCFETCNYEMKRDRTTIHNFIGVSFFVRTQDTSILYILYTASIYSIFQDYILSLQKAFLVY